MDCEPMYRIGKEQLSIIKSAAAAANIDPTTRAKAASLVRLDEDFAYYQGLLEGLDWCYVHTGVLEEMNLSPENANELFRYQLLAMIARTIEIILSKPEIQGLP